MQVKNKTVEASDSTPKKKKKRKKRNLGFLNYIFLFTFVFIGALAGLSYIVNSYSPTVDVSLGDTDENLTLANPESDSEMKTIDERLKWIQMEDEMPSVAIRETLESDNNELLKEEEKISEKNDNVEKKNEEVILEPVQPKSVVPKPAMSEIAKQSSDFRMAARQAVIPAPIPSLTKVYLGSFSSLDEAIRIQQKVGNDMPEVMPFVKSIDGEYIVQIGSFSNKDVANSFIQRAQEKGYSPKIKIEN